MSSPCRIQGTGRSGDKVMQAKTEELLAKRAARRQGGQNPATGAVWTRQAGREGAVASAAPAGH